jgi:hypothetical protein
LTPFRAFTIISAMQTLNLSGESRKSDGPFKSLLWPTVENAWDVDYLGQQGFWICLFIAILSLALNALAAAQIPNPATRLMTFAVAALVSFVYFVGGMGVRQASWPAALMVFSLYVLDHLFSGGVGILSIIIGAVLLSNLRATFLAAKWVPATEGEDRPTRFNETFRDKLVDQFPPRAWPFLKYPFYFFAAVIMLLLFAGFVLHLRHPRSSQIVNNNAAPPVQVSPE